MTDQPNGFEWAVLEGLATLWRDHPGLVPVAFDPDPAAVYTDAELGIYIGRYPQGDGGSITLNEYPVSDAMSLSDSTLGVQVDIRHPDIRAVKALTGDLLDLLHGRGRTMLGSVTLVSARRSSGTNIGQDQNGRQGRTENYYLDVHRPSANRT